MRAFRRIKEILTTLLLAFSLIFSFVSCGNDDTNGSVNTNYLKSFNYYDLPGYYGSEYVVVNGNMPYFEDNEKSMTAYETYSNLDSLGRCTVAMAALHKSIMPTEERESISSVKPTGWIQAKYDIISGGYLYNRCHLIGFQLAGENARETNLITGTRYLNEAMIPFENMVADYLKETGNHVMYRATPIFIGDNLLASGVLLEAYSVEDQGEGICFNVYFYNVQPGVVIDYQTGASHLEGKEESVTKVDTYVINMNNKKIHTYDCSYGKKISDSNKLIKNASLYDLILDGYTKASCCLD